MPVKARYVPMQVMDLQLKYHYYTQSHNLGPFRQKNHILVLPEWAEVYRLYYTMCTLQDMVLNQELNQSVTDGRTDGQV